MNIFYISMEKKIICPGPGYSLVQVCLNSSQGNLLLHSSVKPLSSVLFIEEENIFLLKVIHNSPKTKKT